MSRFRMTIGGREYEGDPHAPFPVETMVPADETDDDRLQRVERCMLALTAEWMQLTGQAEPPMPVHAELSTHDIAELRFLRAQLRHMASIDRKSGPFSGTVPHISGNLGGMVAALDKIIDAEHHADSIPAIDERDIEWHAWPLRTTGGQQVTPGPGIMGLHRPTGIAAWYEDKRSQMRNKAVVVDILRTLVANARRTP